MPSARTLGSVAVCLLLLGTGGAQAARGDDEATAAGALAWSVEAAPFRLEFLKGGRVVVAEPHVTAPTPSPGSRLAYWLADGTVHRVTDLRAQRAVAGGTAYDLATNERGRSARLTVRKSSLGVRVSFEVLPAAGVAGVYEAFTAGSDEHFLGTGERSGYVDVRGQIVQLKVSYDCASTIVTPFYLSSRGYGVYFETSAVGHIQFAGHHDGAACPEGSIGRVALCRLDERFDRVELCVKASRLDYEVYAGTPDQIVTAYTARAGRPALPSPDELAVIKWRDEVGSAAELLDDVNQLQSRGIPLGWELLDNPWEGGACHGTFSFARGPVPDPAKTFAAIHARGVKVMLWISPYVTRKDDCPDLGYPDGSLLGGSALDWGVDFSSDPARSRWQTALEALLGLGVDGVKADRGDEQDYEDQRFSAGTGTDEHNRYPNRYAAAVNEAIRAAGRPIAEMFRAGFAGSPATGFWGGDDPADFDGLRGAIRKGLSASVSGFPVWGSDIGGYQRGFGGDTLPPLTAEVFVRWAQFGALCPIFEIGGGDRNARFWELGATATELLRRFAVLHYELFPYLWQQVRAASATGAPVLRPLGFAYPSAAAAWRHDLELLVGPDLLAAPVTDGRATQQVYLPAGGWVDLFSGAVAQGPATVSRKTPLAELPLYLRRGAAIRLNRRTPDVWAQRWGVNDLDRPGRAGWVYAPGLPQARAGALSASTAGDVVRLSLAGAPAEAQVIVLAQRPPRSVSIGGRAVPRAASLAALRGAAEGWTFAGQPFGGVVLKLQGPAASAVVRLG